MATVGAAYVQVKPSMKGFQKTVGKAGTSAGQKFSSGFRSAAGKALKGGALVGGAAAAAGLVALGAAAVKSAGQIDTAKRTLTGLYGSGKEATKAMKGLRKVAATSPIDYGSYTKAAQSLAYAGVKGKEATGILKNVGKAITAAGGSSENMGRATDAILKMVNAGKVSLDSLQQLSDAGVPIISGLSKHFGKSMSDINKMASAGQIGLDDVLSVMRKGTGKTFQSMIKASDKASKSLPNQWKIAKDNVVTTLGTMLQPVMKKLAPEVGKLGKMISAGLKGIPAALHNAKLQAFFAGVKAGFSVIMEALHPFIVLIGAAGKAVGKLIGLMPPAVWKAIGAGVAVLTAAFVAYQVTMGVVSGAVKALRLAQMALNASMRANPIGLVVTALMLLVGGVIYAYKHFAWFRKGVNAVWKGIKTAISATANWFVHTLVPTVKKALHIMAAPFVWLWKRIIKPAFAGMKLAVRVWWNVVSAIFSLVWHVLKKTLGPVFTWFWKRIIKPVWHGIKTFIRAEWAGIKVIFNAIRNFLRKTLGPVFRWLWKNVIKPVWGGIKNVISGVWKNGIKPIFNTLKKATDHVGGAFKSMGRTIKKVWDAVKRNALKPVKFVVETIINHGIIRGFNKIAGKFGSKKIKEIPLPKGFDVGGWTGAGARLQPAGVVHADEFVVKKASRRKFEARNPGVLDHINRTGRMPGYADGGLVRLAKRLTKMGVTVSQFPGYGPIGKHMAGSLHYTGRAMDLNTRPGTSAAEQRELLKLVPLIHAAGFRIKFMAPGHYNHMHVDDLRAPDSGNFKGASRTAAKGGGFDLGSLLSPFKNLFGKIKSGIGNSGFGKMIGQGAKKLVQMPIDWVKDKAKALFAGAGRLARGVGGNLAKGPAWATGQLWAKSKGFSAAQRKAMNYIISNESGWNPFAKNPTSSAHGLPQMINSTARAFGMPGGWNPVGQLNAWLRYVNSRYGGPVKAANFWSKHHFYDEGGQVAKYDNGGYLPPGVSTVVNATGKPEPVFTSQQFKSMGHGRELPPIYIQSYPDGPWLEAKIQHGADGRIEASARRAVRSRG